MSDRESGDEQQAGLARGGDDDGGTYDSGYNGIKLNMGGPNSKEPQISAACKADIDHCNNVVVQGTDVENEIKPKVAEIGEVKGAGITKEGDIFIKEEVITKEGDDGDSITKEGDGITYEGEDITKEEVITKEGDDGDSITKEGDIIIKEEDDITKEGDSITKEEDAITKEEVIITKEGDGITKEEVIIIKEEVIITKEGDDGDDITKEGDGITKEGDDITKEEVIITKEGDDITKEGDDITKEVAHITKEVDGITKEVDGITKEVDGITKEVDGITKKGDGITKEGDDISKEGDGITKEGDGITKEGDDITKEVDGITKEGEDITKEVDDITKEGDVSCIKKEEYAKSDVKYIDMPTSENKSLDKDDIDETLDVVVTAGADSSLIEGATSSISELEETRGVSFEMTDQNRSCDTPESGGSGEQELATKMLQIQSKRFYLDVKQNKRGRFIKIAEVGANGKKSRLLLAMSTAAEFRDHLSEFSEHYSNLDPEGPASMESEKDGKLKSETMKKDNRRYYLDLKENKRGRFLKVSQIIPRTSQRIQIAIPAQGLIEFRNALTDLLREFGTDDYEGTADLPASRSMRVENKIFYFDVGSNRRGVFMRISEVRAKFRTAITIPEKSWAKFRDIMTDFADSKNNPADDSSN